jgi:hypothetical protein
MSGPIISLPAMFTQAYLFLPDFAIVLLLFTSIADEIYPYLTRKLGGIMIDTRFGSAPKQIL